MFFVFFPNQTQQPRTQTHHKNTNPATQELKPRSVEHKWKQEEKIKVNTNRKNEEQWTQSNHQTQIHHNCPAPSTQPNHLNSPKLRENPNSEIIKPSTIRSATNQDHRILHVLPHLPIQNKNNQSNPNEKPKNQRERDRERCQEEEKEAKVWEREEQNGTVRFWGNVIWILKIILENVIHDVVTPHRAHSPQDCYCHGCCLCFKEAVQDSMVLEVKEDRVRV